MCGHTAKASSGLTFPPRTLWDTDGSRGWLDVVSNVDHDDEKVYVNRTKDQIKEAPEYDDSLTRDDEYRTRLGSHYGPGGVGYRDWENSDSL